MIVSFMLGIESGVRMLAASLTLQYSYFSVVVVISSRVNYGLTIHKLSFLSCPVCCTDANDNITKHSQDLIDQCNPKLDV